MIPGHESYEFPCPFCGQWLEVYLDISCSNQTFIEDCSVCCHPYEISYEARNGELEHVNIDLVQ